MIFFLYKSTLPRGERLQSRITQCWTIYFNPRSRERSDFKAELHNAGQPISIHAPARGATLRKSLSISSLKFQSTLPRGERPSGYPEAVRMWYFNPRSREGSDKGIDKFPCHIHYFNPRSREGATTQFSEIFILLRFQSTLPRGERRQEQSPVAADIKISIHAPARGATSFTWRMSVRSRFQSTLPRGERQRSARYWRQDMNFNPRSREGSDTGGIVTSVLRLISIHAPARGATETLSKAPYISQFQSTLPQGERRSWMHWINGWSPISIHAPARGATLLPEIFNTKTDISIHAPARGATLTLI